MDPKLRPIYEFQEEIWKFASDRSISIDDMVMACAFVIAEAHVLQNKNDHKACQSDLEKFIYALRGEVEDRFSEARTN